MNLVALQANWSYSVPPPSAVRYDSLNELFSLTLLSCALILFHLSL
jgi:hypothetical protein